MFVDAERLLQLAANADTALTGTGNPLTNGLHLSVRESPAHGTYGVISRVGGGDAPSGTYDTPRVSVSVWGPNKQAAAAAAVALANWLRARATNPLPVAGGKVLYAGDVTVLQSPDGNRARYVVDADLGIAPA